MDITDFVRKSIDESLIASVGSPGTSSTSAALELDEVHATETPALPVDEPERNCFDDIKQASLPSPAVSEIDTTGVSEISPIVDSTLVVPNTSMSTTAISRSHDTLVEDPGRAPTGMSVTAITEAIDEVSYDSVDSEDQCALSAPQGSRQADTAQYIEHVQAPEVTTVTVITDLPPTPALSILELHLLVDEIGYKPAPNTERGDTRTVRGETASTIPVELPLLHGRSRYRQPTVIDEHYDDGEISTTLATGAPTTQTICALEGQLIPRLAQNMQIQIYNAKEEIIKTRLPQCGDQTCIQTEAAVAEPFVASSSPTESVPGLTNPSTPPASPLLKSQEMDLPSIMASLAIYPSATSASTQRLKRPLSSTGPEIDAEEKPMVKRQKVYQDEPTAGQVDHEEMSVAAEADHDQRGPKFDTADNQNPTQNGETVDSDVQDDARPDIDRVIKTDPVTTRPKPEVDVDTPIHASALMKDDGLVAASTAPLGTSATADFEAIKQPSPEGHGRQVDPASPAEQFSGPYEQDLSTEMEERVTTASLSPDPEFVVPAPPPTSDHRGPRVTFKPLAPPTDMLEPVKRGAINQGENEDSVLEEQIVDVEEENVEESDEQSEVDDEEISLLFTAMETQDILTPHDPTPPLKESTPTPESQAINGSESSESETAPATNGSIAPQHASNVTTAHLRHEAEFHYERRSTRSETRTSDRSAAPMSSVEDETDPAPVPAIKEEYALVPGNQKMDNKTKEKLKRRQTRSATTGHAAPKPKATSSTTEASRSTRAASNGSAKTASKARPPPKQTNATAVKPKPKPKPKPPVPPESTNPRNTTPSQATAAQSKPKATPRSATPKPDTNGAETKTAIPDADGAGVLGKRTTRRSSALGEETRKAAEAKNNIAKRLRSRDGE